MANDSKTLIVGASGRIGRRIVELFAADGRPIRAMSRRAAAKDGGQVETVIADLAKPATLPPVLEGIDRVFVATGDSPQQAKLENNLLDAAARCGVRLVVKISAFAAGLQPPVAYGQMHAEVERLIEQGPFDWAILRPYMFMQNLLDFTDLIRRRGLFVLPAGDALIALVDSDDVARAAYRLLSGECAERGVFELTGPEALSFEACARILTRVLERPVKYRPVPDWLGKLLMRAQGISRWDADMRIELIRMLRRGDEANTTDHVMRLTGQPAGSFERFARRAFLSSNNRSG